MTDVPEREQHIRDELVRRVVGLDTKRQAFSLDVREEDLIDALTDITDLSREEIEAIARDVRAQYTAQPQRTGRQSRWSTLPRWQLLGSGLVVLLLLLGWWYMRSGPTVERAPVPLDPASTALRQAFLRCCPRPAWWRRVSIKGVIIDSYDDLIAYWQNKKRSKKQFFKAAYQAILDHPQDTDLVVTAIDLMPYTDSNYPYLQQLLEFAIDRYFDYRRPLVNYGGMAGDTIAGIVRKLARIYLGRGQPERAAALIERLLSERGKEINDHMLELIALVHADALYQAGRQADAVAVLQHAIKTYQGGWERDLKQRLARYAQ